MQETQGRAWDGLGMGAKPESWPHLDAPGNGRLGLVKHKQFWSPHAHLPSQTQSKASQVIPGSIVIVDTGES